MVSQRVSTVARAKISAAHTRRRQVSMARRYAANPDAWWNVRRLCDGEVAYAVQLGFEAGYAVAKAEQPGATA